MASKKPRKIRIYTDGACNPNPGPGGWSAIILRPQRKPIKLSGGELHTTNNQMELTAALEALKRLKEPRYICLFTDSKYLRNGITQWITHWANNGWKTKEKTAVKNRELWQGLVEQIKRHQVEWKWTRGHSGNKWNECADLLARSAVTQASLPINEKETIHIFTAAAFMKIEGNGGWGVLLRYGKHVKAINGDVVNTTGNRMHLQAAIAGLSAIKKALPIHLYTTSAYLRDGVTTWVQNWSKQGWKTKDGTPVRNMDQWKILYELVQQYEINVYIIPKDKPPEDSIKAKQLATEAANGQPLDNSPNSHCEIETE